MAAITVRNGRFTVRVRQRGFATQCKTFNRRADALKWGRSVETEMQQGVFKARTVGAETISSVGALLDLYAREISPGKRGGIKEQALISCIRKDGAAKALWAGRIEDASGASVAAVRDRWLAKGLAPATVVRRLAVLSHAFELARREWAVECANPCRSMRLPKISNERTRRVVGDELDRIISATQSEELPTLVRLLVGTAMRRSEALALTWDRVFLEERYVRLDQTKNGTRRHVPLPPVAIAMLRGLERRKDGRVFTLTPDAATRAFARAVARSREDYEDECACLGVPVDPGFLVDIRPHDLRREAISRAVESGQFSLIEVAKISGHRTLTVLHNRYASLHIGALADKLAAAEANAPRTTTA